MWNKTSLREKEINRTAAEMEGSRRCPFFKRTATLLTSASVLQCFSATVVQCCSATVVKCFSGSVLQWFSVALLQCYSASVVQCYSGSVLQCLSATMFQCPQASGNVTSFAVVGKHWEIIMTEKDYTDQSKIIMIIKQHKENWICRKKPKKLRVWGEKKALGERISIDLVE